MPRPDRVSETKYKHIQDQPRCSRECKTCPAAATEQSFARRNRQGLEIIDDSCALCNPQMLSQNASALTRIPEGNSHARLTRATIYTLDWRHRTPPCWLSQLALLSRFETLLQVDDVQTQSWERCLVVAQMRRFGWICRFSDMCVCVCVCVPLSTKSG